MDPSLRIPGFLLVAFLAVVVALSGRIGLGVFVLAAAAATMLPPFPPVFAGVAGVVLPPIPAALAAASLGAWWILLVPIVAVAILTLRWRVTAWAAALTLGSFLFTPGIEEASASQKPHADTPLDDEPAIRSSAREIELRHLDPAQPNAIRAQGQVVIDAPPDAVRDAILDLQARADEGWMVDAVAIYADSTSPDQILRRARWELSILGISITYHCVYEWDREAGPIHWRLDSSKPNDLDLARGVYDLQPEGDTTRLTYTVEVGSKHQAGKALKRSITARNVRKLLASVRVRSEAR